MTTYPKLSDKFSNRVKKSGWGGKIRMFLITLAVVFLVISFFWGEFGFVRIWYLSKKIENLEKDIALLRVQRNDLLWEMDKLKNDPDYIRRYAIEYFGYALPDQKVIQFMPADSSSAGLVRSAASPDPRRRK